MRRTIADSRGSSSLVNDLNAATVAAPSAVHRLHGVTNGLGIFYRQVATNGEVMKGANGRGLDDIETGQIATRRASIPNSHSFTVSVKKI